MGEVEFFVGRAFTQRRVRVQLPSFRGLAARVLAVSLVFSVCSAQEVRAGEKVLSEALGFSIELPEGWIRMSADSFYKNLGRVRFNDEEFQKALAKHASVPALVATKHPEPYEDINPSIKLNVRPYGNLPSKEPLEIISFIVVPLKRVFKDLKVVTGPERVLVNGQNAAHLVVEYTLQSEAGDFPTASELWIVPTQHFFFMIGVGYKQGETADAEVATTAVRSFNLLGVSQQ